MPSIRLQLQELVFFAEDCFLDQTFPRQLVDPDGDYKKDKLYEVRFILKAKCLVEPAIAATLYLLHKRFVQLYTSGQSCTIQVQDTTLSVLGETNTSFPAWFEKPPVFQEEGCFISCEFSLHERLSTDDVADLNGSLSLSLGGSSVTLSQRYMEEKFPRTTVEATIPEVDYTIWGATLIRRRAFNPKKIWNIHHNASAAEKTAIETIAAIYGAQIAIGQIPLISVSDSTLGGSLSASTLMVQFPKYSENTDKSERIYKVQFGLQEA